MNNKSNKRITINTNIFDITKAIVLILVVIFLFFNFNSILDKISNKPITVDHTITEQIATNIVKAVVAENMKDFKEVKKQMEKQNSALLKVVKKDGKRIEEIGRIVAKTKSTIQEAPSNTFIDRETTNSSRTYDELRVDSENKDGQKLPIALVRYHPNMIDSKNGPWFAYTYPLNYNVDIIQTEGDEHGRYIEMYLTNPAIPDFKDRKFKVEIPATNVTWVKKPITQRSFTFNPRIGVAVIGSQNSILPGLGISWFSYGKTKRDIDLRFLTTGISGNDSQFFGYLSPIEYNIGNHIPLIENVFIGPNVMYGIENGLDSTTPKLKFGLNLSVPF